MPNCKSGRHSFQNFFTIKDLLFIYLLFIFYSYLLLNSNTFASLFNLLCFRILWIFFPISFRRRLHAESPEEWTPEVLAECFAASAAQISQILSDERRLSPEQIAAHDRRAQQELERLSRERQLERFGGTDRTRQSSRAAADPLSPAARRERYRFAPDTVARRAVDSGSPVAPAFSQLVDKSGRVRRDVLLDPSAIAKLPADEKRYLNERLDEIYKHKSGMDSITIAFFQAKLYRCI